MDCGEEIEAEHMTARFCLFQSENVLAVSAPVTICRILYVSCCSEMFKIRTIPTVPNHRIRRCDFV